MRWFRGLTLLFLLALARPLAAQQADLLTGRITDARGQPISGVRVEAVSSETEIARSVLTDRNGRYTMLFPDGGGRYVLRKRLGAPVSAPARLHVSGAPGGTTRRSLGRINVFRTAYASWYGPGFYGQRTGCGGTLRPGELGVANKSLPCGSKVTVRHNGRTVRVPVIDRGPYVGAREYDLTEATADRLGFRGHGSIQTTH